MAAPYRYIRKVYKVGNCLMISLPIIWCKANDMKRKGKVEVEVYPDKIVIAKLTMKNDRSK